MRETTDRRPSAPLRFLAWFCPPKLYEGIEGDLLEEYSHDVKHNGRNKANRQLWLNVMKFFRPGIILRNTFTINLNQTIMIRNYVKVASRNIMKRKLYSFINAFGLSIGIAFCILIYLYILDEKSFDQFHVNKDHIYRMEGRHFNTWEPNATSPFDTHAWLQTGLKQALIDDLPEVQYATRFTDNHGILRYGEKVFTEKVHYVDRDFFDMFSFPLVAGNKSNVFKSTSEVVLTPVIAEKYFGKEDPVGKTVSLDVNGEKLLTVVGIIQAPPANSSIDFKILLPQENRPGYEHNFSQWGNYNTPTFVQLIPGADLKTFSRNLDKLVQKYMGDKIVEWRKEITTPIPDGVKLMEYVYTNLNDIHLKKEIGWDKVSDPQYSLILGGIAILILLIACINYVSLALTTSVSRRTEVGIRKVVGAQKDQLVYQFGLESILLAIISMVIGVGLVLLFLPSFNLFTGKSISLAVKDILPLLGFSTGITLIVGIIAGSYPALFLSGFRPALVLKGKFTSRLHAGFTKPLVVLQFGLSAFLIISSVVMYRQMQFVTTKDLGFNKEQVLVIPTQTGWNDEADKLVARYRAALQGEPAVISVAGTTTSFARGYSRNGYMINGEQHSAYVYGIDPYYIPTLGIEMVAGRNFDEQIPSDSTAIIVNEALVKDMKWKDPTSEYLNWKQDSLSRGSQVIGVVKDYHFLSLTQKIEPLFLSIDKKAIGNLVNMLVKVKPGSLPGAVDDLRKVWARISPNMPFDYSFLDEDLAKQYQSYRRWMSIMGLATGFAILISCLGLFGLAGVNAVNRTKEIGIRKVMGAELMNIFLLLNKQYVWLSLIAFALATPVSYYVMQQWLADFQFSIKIGWELIAASMVAGLFIALVTVSYHAIRTAMVNPADTLKHE